MNRAIEYDEALERRIDLACERMFRAIDPSDKRRYEAEMKRLRNRRSAAQVERMEREQGLS